MRSEKCKLLKCRCTGNEENIYYTHRNTVKIRYTMCTINSLEFLENEFKNYSVVSSHKLWLKIIITFSQKSFVCNAFSAYEQLISSENSVFKNT